jgi:hypothetical protein
MKYLLLMTLLLAPSCMPIDPGISKDIDDMVTNQALRVEVDRGALQKETDMEINVRITNKDPAPEAPVINVHPISK